MQLLIIMQTFDAKNYAKNYANIFIIESEFFLWLIVTIEKLKDRTLSVQNEDHALKIGRYLFRY